MYENDSDRFENGHCQIKVKVTVNLQNLSHLPQNKQSGLYLNFATLLLSVEFLESVSC